MTTWEYENDIIKLSDLDVNLIETVCK